MDEESVERPTGHRSFGSWAGWTFAVLSAFGAFKLFQWQQTIRWAFRKILTAEKGAKMRQRLFAPFVTPFAGAPAGEQQELVSVPLKKNRNETIEVGRESLVRVQEEVLRSAIKYAHNVARRNGYAMYICNLDRDYQYRDAFNKAQFKTIFLQRRANPQEQETSAPSPFTAGNFFDPRDI